MPPRAGLKVQIDCDKMRYRQRQNTENMFCRLKDWRRIHIRYDRCAHAFVSTIIVGATVIFWL